MKLYTGSEGVNAPWLDTIGKQLHTKRRVAIQLDRMEFPYFPEAEVIEHDILRVFQNYRGEIDYTRAYQDGSRVNALELEMKNEWNSVLDACCHNRVMLNICNLHREIPYLGEAASMISGALNANVRLDAFCSGPGMAATPIHYDYDNAFVMQLIGTKHWRCYDNLSNVYLHFGGYRVDASAIGEKHFEKVMTRGDGIFIPGGTLHEAFTSEVSSIHLAIDLSPIVPDATIGDLLRSRLESLIDRGDSFEPYSRDVADKTLEVTRKVVQEIQTEDVQEWHQRYLMWAASRYHRIPPRQYRGNRAHVLRMAPGAWARLRHDGDTVVVDYQTYNKAVVTSLPWTFRPASMALPIDASPVLERIFGSPQGNRLSKLDELLSPESTDVLAGALIQVGLLVEEAE